MAIVKFCSEEYLKQPPFDDYISSCGLAKVSMVEPDALDKDDFCVKVVLVRKLPEDLTIAPEKDGVKIFTRVKRD